MRLWIITNKDFVSPLRMKSKISGVWDKIYSAEWRPALRWMVEQMSQRGVNTDGLPPMWAWHSCNGFNKPPTENTLQAFVDNDCLSGVILTLEVPDDLIVLSRYGAWQDLLNLCYLPYSDKDVKQFTAASSLLGTEGRLDLDYSSLKILFEEFVEQATTEDSIEDLTVRIMDQFGTPVFDVPESGSDHWDVNGWDIQACMPYLHYDWVVEAIPYSIDR